MPDHSRPVGDIVAGGADHLSGEAGLEATLQGIAAAARAALGALRATCYANDVEAQVLSGVFSTEDDPERLAFLRRSVGYDAERLPIWGLHLTQSDPLLAVEDVSSDARVPPALAARLGIGAFLGVRLEHASIGDGAPALLGTLFCSYARPRIFTESERMAARGLANLAALALANAHLQAVTAQNLRQNRALAAEQAALRRVATKVAGEAPPEVVFGAVAKEVATLLGVECGLVARYEPGCAVPVGWWGVRRTARTEMFPLEGAGALAQVARSGRPARVADYAALDADPIGAVARRSRYRSGVAAPVRVAGRLWGALLAATKSELPIDDAAEMRLARFAELIALAIANAEARARLATLAATDPLTGLANHRAFFERVHADVERARRHGRPLSLIVIDLDHFKRVNDRHGHQVGDRVLSEVAERLSGLARAEDTVARVGGEEFAWLLPESDAAEALAVADRARRAIGELPFDEVGRMTMSGGVAALTSGGNELFRAADAALYRAKAEGRDTCVAWSAEIELRSRPGREPDETPGVERLLRLANEQVGLTLSAVGEFVDGSYVFRHLAGKAEAFGAAVGVEIPLNETICRRVVEGALPNVIRDAQREERVRSMPGPAATSIGAYVGVPITFPDGDLYGSLCCLSPHAEPALGSADTRLLRILAGLIGEELERERHEGRARARERGTIVRVMEGHGLSVVLQPIVELDGGRVVAAEALSRIDHGPLRPPDAWFAAAAAADLGVELELVAVNAALGCIGRVPADARLSLNVSPDTLCSPELARALAHVPGKRLALEMTEHAPVRDYPALVAALAELRQRGVQLVVDDAGAGFASLRHVLGLHPDVIKLDISLTRQIERDPVRRALASSLVVFAKEVGATIVAEGIESREELSTLRMLGVSHGQGYYIARPGPGAIPERLEIVSSLVAAAG